VRQQQDGRHDQGAERIDVPQRVEADPALVPGGVVAEMMRDKAVGGFMKGDGDDGNTQTDTS
jgi:hypothetical protein